MLLICFQSVPLTFLSSVFTQYIVCTLEQKLYKVNVSYLLSGRIEFGRQLLPQLIQLLPEQRLLLLQWLTLPLKLLLQLLWRTINNTTLSKTTGKLRKPKWAQDLGWKVFAPEDSLNPYPFPSDKWLTLWGNGTSRAWFSWRSKLNLISIHGI